MEKNLEKLKAIIEASKKLTSVLDLGELLGVTLDVALQEIEAERGTVFLLDAARGEIFSRILRADEIDEVRLPVGKGIAGWVVEHGAPLIIADAYTDPRFDPEIDHRTGFRTHDMLCLPLKKADGETLGAIQLLNKKGGTFTSDDVDYLSALASHMVIALQNAKHHLERLEQERTLKELELAAQIQLRLLPQWQPEIPGLSLRAVTRPCRYVGGDYFDFLKLPGGRLGVVIADVSGKGVPASLITSALHAYMQALVETYAGPAALAHKLNKLVRSATLASSFLTMVFLEIDAPGGRLRICNCGHNPPVYLSEGKTTFIKPTGTILGMFPKVEFDEIEIAPRPGDAVLLYTDGLTEATPAAGGEETDREEFGAERLLEICRLPHADAASWIRALEQAVEAFTAGAPLEDDLTIVALRFGEPGGAA